MLSKTSAKIKGLIAILVLLALSGMSRAGEVERFTYNKLTSQFERGRADELPACVRGLIRHVLAQKVRLVNATGRDIKGYLLRRMEDVKYSAEAMDRFFDQNAGEIASYEAELPCTLRVLCDIAKRMGGRVIVDRDAISVEVDDGGKSRHPVVTFVEGDPERGSFELTKGAEAAEVKR